MSAGVIRLRTAQGIAETCLAEMLKPVTELGSKAGKKKGTSWTAQMQGVPACVSVCLLPHWPVLSQT